jgi:formamidopyrimidine-DNA glycosylase
MAENMPHATEKATCDARFCFNLLTCMLCYSTSGRELIFFDFPEILMPELPEVETIARGLAPKLIGRVIIDLQSFWPRQMLPNLQIVYRAATDRRISIVTRRGKHLVWEFENCGALLIHLRMSGRFEWQIAGEPEPLHGRVRFDLDSGESLWFVDARKFGRVRFVEDWRAATADLGVEPLSKEFTAGKLGQILATRKRQIKPLLLDQMAIAGLGNIYTDEALFQSGVHPKRLSNSLNQDEVKKLHRAIRNVLKAGIMHNGTSFDWIYPGGKMQDYLNVYGRTGELCPSCQAPIAREVIGQRASHFCPNCQK